MTAILLLFAIGIVFLGVEVFVPGAILGSIGALLMGGACILSLIDGHRYEAFCQSGQAAAGSTLQVVAADNFRLIVTQTPSH